MSNNTHTTTGAGTSAALPTFYKVRNTASAKFFGPAGKYPSVFDSSVEVEKFGFFVSERYALILNEAQVNELYDNFDPADLQTIQLNGKGWVFLKNKLTGKYYADGKCFSVDEDEATLVETPSATYATIKYSYDLREVWHVVPVSKRSTHARAA
jgi:hypothetical protein